MASLSLDDGRVTCTYWAARFPGEIETFVLRTSMPIEQAHLKRTHRRRTIEVEKTDRKDDPKLTNTYWVFRRTCDGTMFATCPDLAKSAVLRAILSIEDDEGEDGEDGEDGDDAVDEEDNDEDEDVDADADVADDVEEDSGGEREINTSARVPAIPIVLVFDDFDACLAVLSVTKNVLLTLPPLADTSSATGKLRAIVIEALEALVDASVADRLVSLLTTNHGWDIGIRQFRGIVDTSRLARDFIDVANALHPVGK